MFKLIFSTIDIIHTNYTSTTCSYHKVFNSFHLTIKTIFYSSLNLNIILLGNTNMASQLKKSSFTRFKSDTTKYKLKCQSRITETDKTTDKWLHVLQKIPKAQILIGSQLLPFLLLQTNNVY